MSEKYNRRPSPPQYSQAWNNAEFAAVERAMQPYEEGAWTPTATGFTVVGTATFTGRYVRIGRMVFIAVIASATTSLASTADTSHLTLPIVPDTDIQGYSLPVTSNFTENVGVGQIATGSGGLIFTPTWSASAHLFYISGWYRAA